MGNITSAGQYGIPEDFKNSYAGLREHYADDLPVWTQDGFEIVKVDVAELLTQDQTKLAEIGGRIVNGLFHDNVVILRNSNDSYSKLVAAFNEAKVFLSSSEAHKKTVSTPGVDKNGKRAYYSGYSLIHFPNNSNRRDPEWRDVFQVRLSEDGHIPWPSEAMKKTCLQLYETQWEICVKVLQAIGLSLNVDPLDLLNMVGYSSEDGTIRTPDPAKSKNTNLCYFHYYDKKNIYKSSQKCMVHQDNGLLTLLPKSDLPGIEILHPQLQQWLPMEQFIEDDEMLLYCGEALRVVTNSLVVPATHRVVRHAPFERFSMPFEMKPEDDAVLKNLVDPTQDKEPRTFDAMVKGIDWAKIMRQVNRSDGIEPGSAEEQELIREYEAAKAQREAQAAAPQPSTATEVEAC